MKMKLLMQQVTEGNWLTRERVNSTGTGSRGGRGVDRPWLSEELTEFISKKSERDVWNVGSSAGLITP
jgi:hypothetical protein